MAMGLSGSLDDAIPTAMANMTRWLADDYKRPRPRLRRFSELRLNTVGSVEEQ